jgi:hypothetical protein
MKEASDPQAGTALPYGSVNEIDLKSAEQKINNLPQGKLFDDAKNIESIFNKSRHSWSKTIESFEKNKDKGKEQNVDIKDIYITQPNIQNNKVKNMIANIDKLPAINVVEFPNGEKVIYDGHHRLIANWALGNTKIKVNLVQANELNENYQFKVSDKNYDEEDNSLISVDYNFSTPDNDYRVEFNSGEYNPELKKFDVSFGLDKGYSFKLDTFQMTGEGNALSILKTIVNIIKDFTNRFEVNKLVINPTSKKRGKIYSMVLKSLPSDILNKVELINENQVATAAESFYLNIPKFNQPKTVQQYLIESINEISLSKENAAKINGDLTGGTFTVGDITYEYSIKNIPNPYKDLGLFYNIQFTPSGEVTSIPKGGKENYIKILSTMYKIILDFIEKEQPTYVGISSLDNSGDKNYHTVYNRLTSNHMGFIPGYFRKDSNLTFDSPQGKGRFIVLKKKDNLDEKKSKDSFGLNAYARELVKETFKEDWNLKEGMLSLSRYMIDNGMNIKPLPKIKVIDNDAKNASNLLGKTAYYNPVEKSITLFTMNRHPKDVLRSFAHEMIHHEQNLNGKLNNITTQNTNEDGDLPEIEREAYEKGNMMLRNWEDSIKNV